MPGKSRSRSKWKQKRRRNKGRFSGPLRYNHYMGHTHHHSHSHHHHGDLSAASLRGLWGAVAANIVLTLAQLIGGIIAGSLSLIADALHNFSDAASLVIALVAIRIGRRPPDQIKTFGYKRAETIAALINLTALVIIGFYLVIEATKRFYMPQPIEGWPVIILAGLAIVINGVTAFLTYRQAKHSTNIRAAFLHNLSDALASVGVIVAGALILLYNWVWADAAITIVIAGYVLWQGLTELPKVIHLLMDGTPVDVDIEKTVAGMQELDGVADVHHVHVWQLNEQQNALEAHIVLETGHDMDAVKRALKALLHEKFGIGHSTLEFENTPCDASCRMEKRG